MNTYWIVALQGRRQAHGVEIRSYTVSAETQEMAVDKARGRANDAGLDFVIVHSVRGDPTAGEGEI